MYLYFKITFRYLVILVGTYISIHTSTFQFSRSSGNLNYPRKKTLPIFPRSNPSAASTASKDQNTLLRNFSLSLHRITEKFPTRMMKREVKRKKKSPRCALFPLNRFRASPFSSHSSKTYIDSKQRRRIRRR